MVLTHGVELRDTVSGKGLIASRKIKIGEDVWWDDKEQQRHLRSTPHDSAWIEALPVKAREAYTRWMYATGENEFRSLPEFETLPLDEWAVVEPEDSSLYMNHSCDPTCWFESSRLITARRDIYPGEEVTIDYATSELTDQGWDCKCGSSVCRTQVKGNDWMLHSLQSLYHGHFLSYVQAMIDQKNLSTLLSIREHSDALLSKWDVHLKEDPEVGTYLSNGLAVPKGQLVLILPPNKILTFSQIMNDPDVHWNQVMCVRRGPKEVSLFSSSTDTEAWDNFLNHSCEPNLEFAVRDDFTVDLYAARDIAANEMLSFDYEETEDDLTLQGVSFTCACEAPSCRGEILGRLFKYNLLDKPVPVVAVLPPPEKL